MTSAATPHALNRLPAPVQPMGAAVGVLLSVVMSAAMSAQTQTGTAEDDVALNFLTRLEARTLQNEGDKAVRVQLEGEFFSGQTVQLEQNGLVIYEQQLKEGAMRINNLPPLNNRLPLLVRLVSPNQPPETMSLALQPNVRREIFAKRPELFALAPLAKPVPLSDKLPSTDLQEDIEFDADFLRGKGFRNLSAIEIKKLGSVKPGNFNVDIYRNGSMVSKGFVRFVEHPQKDNVSACLSPALFQLLGVKPSFVSPKGLALLKSPATPVSTLADNASAADCLFIEDWVNGATSEFDLSDLRLDFTIAQAFLNRANRQSVPPELLTRGENAGFINYALNNYNAQGNNSNFVNFNAGINLGGWQLRQSSYFSQSSTSTSKTSQYVTGETYVKRPLIDLKANVVIGDISTNSPIIGSSPIRGARLSSEENLLPEDERGYRPVITGVARTNARVRVSQNNTVFFEQNVPPGPFEFDNINPISSLGNLTVVIAEADGSQQTYTVPYSQSAGKLNPGSYRYSIATGLYRNLSSTQNNLVLQASLRYGFTNFTTPGIEVLMGPNYRNLGLQASFNSALGVLNFNTLFSHFDATQATRTGYAYNANFNPPRVGRFSLYAGWGHQSLNYTTPSTALSLGSNASFTNDSFKNNAFLSLGVGFDHWGSFNVGTSQQSSWSDVGSNQVRFGYSNRIRQVNLGLNWDRATYSDSRPPQTSISISASIPLGSGPHLGNARASMSQIDDNEPSQTLSYSGYVSDEQISYNLNQSQNADSSTTSASGNVQHRYGSLGVSVSSSTGNSQQSGLNANGGLVFHSGGVILAPSVSETFAIVEVPQGEGVGLIGSAARINRSGFGVLPAIAPYSFNDVQISLEGASPDLEIDNASQKVAPVEGSIVRLKFNTSSGKPLLIVFQPTNGVLVPIGATVFDSQGNEVGTVGQGSRAMVRVQSLKDRLKAVWGDKPSENCSAEYDLNAKNVTSSNGYTLLKIRCEMAGTNDKTEQAKAKE